MRLHHTAAALAVLCCACQAQIADGTGTSASGVDANPDPTPGSDAAIDSMPVPLCASRSVYLNFEGQTLTQGRSDATLNQAEWMQIPQGTAPPYLAGDANRQGKIKAIVDGVSSQLSRFPITVVTTRPATGRYVMIVYGGQPGQVGSAFGGAVNRLDCDDSRPNDVAWMGDNIGGQRAINSSIGAIGFGLGMTATLDTRDCMCGWDNTCRPDASAPCTLGSPIARDGNANQRCNGAGAMQDEVAALRKAFCQ